MTEKERGVITSYGSVMPSVGDTYVSGRPGELTVFYTPWGAIPIEDFKAGVTMPKDAYDAAVKLRQWASDTDKTGEVEALLSRFLPSAEQMEKANV